MAAIWNWYRAGYDATQVGDENGWSFQASQGVNPPESVQRVIIDVGCSGWADFEYTQQWQPVVGGLIRVELILQADAGDEAVATMSRPLTITCIEGDDTNTNTHHRTAFASHEAIRLDTDLRRAAPPPPANPLNLLLLIDWRPSATSVSDYLYMPFWQINFDFNVLTSQPGL